MKMTALPRRALTRRALLCQLLLNIPLQALLFSPSAQASEATRAAPLQAVPGSFNAVLDSRSQRWRLLEPDGSSISIEVEGCGEPPRVPAGLWLLIHDRDGRSRLIAPSATVLPEGHAGEIVVAACDDHAAVDALHLPGNLLSTLKDHASAILVRH